MMAFSGGGFSAFRVSRIEGPGINTGAGVEVKNSFEITVYGTYD